MERGGTQGSEYVSMTECPAGGFLEVTASGDNERTLTPECDRRILVVGGSPEVCESALLREVACTCAAVVAVDRGLDAVLAAALSCDVFCGDADSVNNASAALVRLREAGGEAPIGEVVRYNPHKDDTDLGLALAEIARRWPGAAITATCLSGGHPDHALAVIGRLASWPGAVELMEDDFTARILHEGDAWTIDQAEGARFSFVPLTPEAVVSEEGMRWRLDHAHVPLLSDLGISNVIESPRATITSHIGTLITWLFST